MNLTPYNDHHRPAVYTAKINEFGEIDESIRVQEILEQNIWAKTHIVAIVAIVAMTYMKVSDDNKSVEISKNKIEKIETYEAKKEEMYNFRKFIGVGNK